MKASIKSKSKEEDGKEEDGMEEDGKEDEDLKEETTKNTRFFYKRVVLKKEGIDSSKSK